MEPDYNSQLIIDLKNEIIALKQYISDHDAAVILAAEQKAAADAVAAQTASDDAAAQKVIDDAVIATEKQADLDFKSSLLEKTTQTNDLLITLNGKQVFAPIDNTTLLTEIKTAVTPNADNTTVEFYADMSLIVLVMGLIPIYIVVKLIKWIFDMLERAF